MKTRENETRASLPTRIKDAIRIATMSESKWEKRKIQGVMRALGLPEFPTKEGRNDALRQHVHWLFGMHDVHQMTDPINNPFHLRRFGLREFGVAQREIFKNE